MLDLTKLAGQLPGMSLHLQAQAIAGQERLDRAHLLLQKAQENLPLLQQKHLEWGDTLIFNCATPLEPLDTHIPINRAPQAHTVFATDGSQIAPSHHEIAYCYLINIGRIMLHYGQSLHPLLDSIPEVFYKSEDLYIAKQWGIRTDEWMGYLRTVCEVERLAEMACRWVLPPGSHADIPNLAMVDGSLVYWFLENLPTEARLKILTPILNAWEQLRDTKIPLMGYLSASRSIDATHFLRLQSCPFETPDCATHCSDAGDNLPCQSIEPLRDISIWGKLIAPGERSGLWRSSSRILNLYPPEDQVCFCYLNVGEEIARVEMPQWVADDAQLLDQSLGIVLAQVQKGLGYPVAIAEAHNQAVIRGGDRSRFFALLEHQLLKTGVKNIGISYKETRKRGSIA